MLMNTTGNRRDKASQSKAPAFALIILALMICAVILMAPNSVEAWPTKFQNCMNCHALEDPDGSIFTAIDGSDQTPIIDGDPINISITAGESFEVDWYVTNSTDAANGYGVGVSVSVPTGWSIDAGTDNAPNLPGWHQSWDQADGIGWSPNIFDTSNYLPNSEGKTVDFTGNAWETGSRNAACDQGGSCINGGTDSDGMEEAMGSDAIITVPADTAPGTYDVMVFGVGHEVTNGKAHKDQIIKVTVQSLPGSADYHTDIGSGSYGGMNVTWTACSDPATGSVGILSQNTGNYTCADAQQLYSGTPNETLMTWVSTSQYTANTDITGGMLYAHLGDDDKADGTVRFQLGYVQGGSFTSFGNADVTVLDKDKQTFSVDLSGISGQAPIGSYLALRHIDISGQQDITYFGTAEDPSGSIRFQVTETARYDLLTASGNTPIASSNPNDGDPDILMQRFQVDSDTGDNGEIELSSLDLIDSGTATEIQNAEVYISTVSSATLPGGAAFLGSTGLWDGSLTTVTFGGTLADRTVPNGTPKFIYVVYHLASGQGGTEIQSSVQAVNVVAPDLGYGFVGTSNTLTVQGVDALAPTVTDFTATSPSASLNIPITSFTASDNVGVTGYLITESATPPLPTDLGWQGTAPATYTVASDGTYTLYPWAKDAADNVSAVYATPATVNVDTTAPTVTGFTATSPSNSLDIPITSFTATDNFAVTGYLITESATPPAAGNPGWQGSAPATYTVASDGTYTLYPWAKDAAGNVSAVYATPATVDVDTVAGHPDHLIYGIGQCRGNGIPDYRISNTSAAHRPELDRHGTDDIYRGI
jgi:hypothetical protein